MGTLIMNDNRVIITLFGATGDLAARKLYPALYRLFQSGQLQEHFALIGTGRTQWTNEKMREVVANSIEKELGTQENIEAFLSHMYYLTHDVHEVSDYEKLREFQNTLDEQYEAQGNRLFYISLSPTLFPVITSNLKAQGLITQQGYNRLMIEKPFGNDEASAQALQEKLNQSFNEDQIYRIDHYLGKENVQAILPFRYENDLFRERWNYQGIESIEISLLEEVGIENRGEYYEQSGALKDMVQNHIMQLIALLTMRLPNQLDAQKISEEKVQILKHIVPIKNLEDVQERIVRGQYGASETIRGYRQEEKVSKDSQTDTYIAACLEIDLPEWRGVPIFIRTGKRLKEKTSRIVVTFKSDQSEKTGNQLVIDLAAESNAIQLILKQKTPGYSTQIVKTPFIASCNQVDDVTRVPQDYERLILACLVGDKQHFAHYLEVKFAWRYIDSVTRYWDKLPIELPNYLPGTNGPKEADELAQRFGYEWY